LFKIIKTMNSVSICVSLQKSHLQSMLAGESRAYGFTIAFWGSGALLINEFGAPNIILALCFGFGAVLGFGILMLSAFKSGKAENSEEAILVLSSIHYLSALIPMIVAHALITLNIRPELTFLFAGMSVSMLYNLLSILEQDIAQIIQKTLF